MGHIIWGVYCKKNEPLPHSSLMYRVNGSILSANFHHEQEWILLLSHIERNPYRFLKIMTIEKKDDHMVGHLVFE